MVIEILATANLLLSAGVIAFIRKEATKISGKLAESVSEIRTHLLRQSAELHSSISSEAEKTRTEVTKATGTVTEYLTGHAESLNQSLVDIKAHAKEVIDLSSQRLNDTNIQRAVCPFCQRTVYKFQKRGDGSIFKCLDCASR